MKLRKCNRCKTRRHGWQYDPPTDRTCQLCRHEMQTTKLEKQRTAIERRREYQRKYQQRRRKETPN